MEKLINTPGFPDNDISHITQFTIPDYSSLQFEELNHKIQGPMLTSTLIPTKVSRR